ncbi:MAG: translocation/assembly module TamB domain-containing protein [Deltaproteobacteria bacterium]|nr:translocation/assembly module TamB domain-containing protein [Deltaproteobacteria bacterium]
MVARIRLILGNQVRLKGSGFDARISGNPLAFDEPGKETTGTGELEIKDGTYKAYGQDLTIERGRVARHKGGGTSWPNDSSPPSGSRRRRSKPNGPTRRLPSCPGSSARRGSSSPCGFR